MTRGETKPIASLRLRLNQNLALLQRYEAIHDRTIAAVASSADVEAHERSRDKFEDMYYHLLGAIQVRIESLQTSATSSSARYLQFTSTSPATSVTPLPQFHGYRGEWGHFRDSFESLSNLDRFHYLISAVKGVSTHTLKRFPVSGSSFEGACELLRGRYEDDDDNDEDNKLNNRHHRQQQQQRGAVHRTDEVSPAKRNLLSPTLGGGVDLIGVKFDLLTDLPANPSNGELLINNDAHKKCRRKGRGSPDRGRDCEGRC
ncbi:hypothetical protein K0M31_001955 [Melipona bicolor]|uniref:Uncharacterized protein n=1 Tax=Melipona bicolor TaxID=60889 RepID=A0AA40GGM2_9HYME|nr:hypothetical protein K0M31_001955 [Melipona bicolor]